MKTTLALAALASLIAAPALAAGPTCTSNADWLIVEKPHKDDVGNSYIVRSKAASPQPACSTKAAKGDRVIGKSDDPFFLLKLAGNYLMIDAGTGPDRGLVIYDLRDGSEIFSAGYDDETFKADATGASFWTETGAKATRKNCPNIAAIEKDYLTPTIEAKARFDFAKGAVTVSKDTRCRATQ